MGWFRRVRSEFCPRFAPFIGKPITYVEIGCWRGDSASWVAENVLTNPNSSGIGIDPYTEETGSLRNGPTKMEQARLAAVERLSPFSNWSWIFQDSKKAFRRWRRPIDILYIDGLHDSHYVMQDFCLAWPYVKEGGVIIFDDFRIGQRKRFPHVPEAVAAILLSFQGMIKVCENNNKQFAVDVVHKHAVKNWHRAIQKSDYDIKYALSVIDQFTKEKA